MSVSDRCCTLAPYFKVSSGKLETFKKLCARFVAKTHEEQNAFLMDLVLMVTKLIAGKAMKTPKRF